jgi:hypothetical protein
MQIHDVFGNRPVACLRVLIADQKDQVETGQDGGLKVDVLAWRLFKVSSLPRLDP